MVTGSQGIKSEIPIHVLASEKLEKNQGIAKILDSSQSRADFAPVSESAQTASRVTAVTRARDLRPYVSRRRRCRRGSTNLGSVDRVDLMGRGAHMKNPVIGLTVCTIANSLKMVGIESLQPPINRRFLWFYELVNLKCEKVIFE